MRQYLAPGVYVDEMPSAIRPIAGVGTSTAGFIGVVPDEISLPAPLKGKRGEFISASKGLAEANQPVLVTGWTDFARHFGDLVGEEVANGTAVQEVEINAGFRNLAHAVYGFFNNGGTRCYVARVGAARDIGAALEAFAAIDEIAIVAIPGVNDAAAQNALIDHCENQEDRFAILDGAPAPATFTKELIRGGTRDSSYAAIYFPWIRVFDPSQKLMFPNSDGSLLIPPSGHIAGIYTRVDTERGVHKAPANEVIRGAQEVGQRLSKAHQEGLNPAGVNVIRNLNGAIRLWGARTLGGDDNGDLKYISTRRLLNFLRESIDEGTRWVVFEPNDSSLWAKISRNVSAFLTNVWRSGALFGNTPEEAFYVRCDATTNPSGVREKGQVVTEVGVAIVRPAEFVIFRLSQWSGPGG